MRKIDLAGACSAFGLLVGSCAQPAPEPPPFKPIATTIELMRSVVDPAADVLWGSVGSIVTAEGTEDFFPRSEEEWIVVENACVVLMESGNLLMIGDRARDRGDWMTHAQGLVDAGRLALDAARSRNPDQIFAIGGEVYASCDSCHQKYWVEGTDPTESLPSSP
jgi:hypothetical protein